MCTRCISRKNNVTYYYTSTSSTTKPHHTVYYTYIHTLLKQRLIGSFDLNPKFSKVEFYIRYILVLYNVIDILCILPYYIQAYTGNSTTSTASFLRVLRILRVIKVSLQFRLISPLISANFLLNLLLFSPYFWLIFVRIYS